MMLEVYNMEPNMELTLNFEPHSQGISENA